MSSPMSQTVRHLTLADRMPDTPDEPFVPFAGQFGFDTAEPYAVTVEFRTGGCEVDGWIIWWIGRDLLAAGLHRPAGARDVRVFPDGPWVAVGFAPGPGPYTWFRFPRVDVERFLVDTYALVPADVEFDQIGWDELVAACERDQR